MNMEGEAEEGDGPSEKSVEKGRDKVGAGTLLADTPITRNQYPYPCTCSPYPCPYPCPLNYWKVHHQARY